MERQPGMSRETTDRERSVLFVQVCIYICVCVSASSTLPAREWLWDWNVVPVREFLKSETHWHFKQTGDISVASSALFSFYYQAPFTDVTKIVLIVSGDVSPEFYRQWNHSCHLNWQMEMFMTSKYCRLLHRHFHRERCHEVFLVDSIKTWVILLFYGVFCVILTFVVLNPCKFPQEEPQSPINCKDFSAHPGRSQRMHRSCFLHGSKYVHVSILYWYSTVNLIMPWSHSTTSPCSWEIPGGVKFFLSFFPDFSTQRSHGWYPKQQMLF